MNIACVCVCRLCVCVNVHVRSCAPVRDEHSAYDQHAIEKVRKRKHTLINIAHKRSHTLMHVVHITFMINSI